MLNEKKSHGGEKIPPNHDTSKPSNWEIKATSPKPETKHPQYIVRIPQNGCGRGRGINKVVIPSHTMTQFQRYPEESLSFSKAFKVSGSLGMAS